MRALLLLSHHRLVPLLQSQRSNEVCARRLVSCSRGGEAFNARHLREEAFVRQRLIHEHGHGGCQLIQFLDVRRKLVERVAHDVHLKTCVKHFLLHQLVMPRPGHVLKHCDERGGIIRCTFHALTFSRWREWVHVAGGGVATRTGVSGRALAPHAAFLPHRHALRRKACNKLPQPPDLRDVRAGQSGHKELHERLRSNRLGPTLPHWARRRGRHCGHEPYQPPGGEAHAHTGDALELVLVALVVHIQRRRKRRH
mmetsp:Transcript_28742/g.54274  ORF Transcript_28742/g.54274 Transcript_28742/m.54274 type:complete len:254 (+) Transcript_28742:1385-2146(+)